MSIMEEKVSGWLMNASKLPGYRIHPSETYRSFKALGLKIPEHPREIFKLNHEDLHRVAFESLRKNKRKLGAIGFATGLPGGPVGLTVGTVVDIEEYVRMLFRLTQQLGHVYGLIPCPYSDDIDSDVDDYFESVQEKILLGMLVGLGAGSSTLLVTKVAANIAQKQAKNIIRKTLAQQPMIALTKQIGKVLVGKVTKQGIAKCVGRAIPVIGGVINGAVSYGTVKVFGERLIKGYGTEFENCQKSVLDYWDGQSSSEAPESTVTIPPLVDDPAEKWHLAEGKKYIGELCFEEIRDKIGKKEVEVGQLRIWKPGMPAWSSLAESPELTALSRGTETPITFKVPVPQAGPDLDGVQPIQSEPEIVAECFAITIKTLINLMRSDCKVHQSEQDFIEEMIIDASIDEASRQNLLSNLNSKSRITVDYAALKRCPDEALALMVLLTELANVDGQVHPAEKIFIRGIGQQLGFSDEDIQSLMPD